MSTPKFPLGQTVITPAAMDAVSPFEIVKAMARYIRADWGDLDEYDKRVNDEALEEGNRLLAAYHTREGTKFWIITEWDRSVTTVLLPSDY